MKKETLTNWIYIQPKHLKRYIQWFEIEDKLDKNMYCKARYKTRDIINSLLG